VESFLGHLKHEWPYLTRIADAGTLDRQLSAVRRAYNRVRPHAGIGYVTPDDEHAGRGAAIRHARRVGLWRARRARLAYHRHNHPDNPS
jgi:transposase InsO family protein